MALSVIGKKAGMTRIFTEDGDSIPVSVIVISENIITQIKSAAGVDGYDAIQVGTGVKKAIKVNKASKGHFAKAGVQPTKLLRESRVTAELASEYKVGDIVKIDAVAVVGNYVDVMGTSRGKGFAGVIKRHNFSSQRMTHGNSLSHRAPGSIGQCQDPGRVFKGKKMAGHMGNARSTMQTLKVVRVDLEKGIILVKGAIPGAPNSDVTVTASVKKSVTKAA